MSERNGIGKERKEGEGKKREKKGGEYRREREERERRGREGEGEEEGREEKGVREHKNAPLRARFGCLRYCGVEGGCRTPKTRQNGALLVFEGRRRCRSTRNTPRWACFSCFRGEK
jgi:hypothetical protein